MKRSAALIALLLAVGSQHPLLSREMESVRHPQALDTVSALTDLDHEWLAASVKRDTGFLHNLFSDDFVEILDGGETLSKAQLLSAITAANTHQLSVTSDDVKVTEILPELAIVTDTTTIVGLFKGQEFNSKYRVFRIFLKQQGQWHAAGAVLAHLAAESNVN